MAQQERRRSYLEFPLIGRQSMPSRTLQSHKDRRYSIRGRVSSPRALWSSPTTSFRQLHNLEDDCGPYNSPEKKSIILKVKEKAKKWRQLLAKKRNKQADNNASPPWGVHLEEADHEDGNNDLNYHALSKYESETGVGTDYYCPSPSTNKSTIRYPSRIAGRETEMKLANDTIKVAPKAESAVSNNESDNESASVGGNNESASVRGNNESAVSNKSNNDDQLAAPVSEMLAVVSGASQVIAAKIQESRPRCENAARQIWDKGVWMKEYLLQKLEPGEGDRALYEVITEAVSPRKATSFTSLTELQGQQTNRNETTQQEKAESPLPISTNPHPAEVEVEVGGRELESYKSKRCSS